MMLQQAVEIAARHANTARDAITYNTNTLQIHADGRITAHDLRGGIIVQTDDLEGLEAAVDAKRAVKAVKSCGKDPELSIAGDSLVVKGDGGRFKIPTVALADVPAIKEPADDATWFKVSGQDFGAIARVAWSRSDDTTRAHLHGVYLDGDHVIAVSGHTMCQYRLSEDVQAGLGGKSPVCLMPETILSLSGEVDMCLGLGDEKIFVRSGDEIRVAPTADVNMPPVADILKGARAAPAITVDKKILSETIHRAQFATAKEGGLILALAGNQLTISGEDTQSQFSFVHTLEVGTRDPEVKDGKLQANGRYLSSAIDAVDSPTVTLRAVWTEQGSIDPIHFAGDRCEGIVMPMRM